jgi:hypothetical protein
MNRATFITTTFAAVIGLETISSLTTNAGERKSMSTTTQQFWPDKSRLVVSISTQFETGSQPERGAGSPFPALDPKYPDLPAQK